MPCVSVHPVCRYSGLLFLHIQSDWHPGNQQILSVSSSGCSSQPLNISGLYYFNNFDWKNNVRVNNIPKQADSCKRAPVNNDGHFKMYKHGEMFDWLKVCNFILASRVKPTLALRYAFWKVVELYIPYSLETHQRSLSWCNFC